LASIYLVYGRIPGKGITLHRLLWDDDDDTSEIIMFDLIKSGIEVNSGRGNGY
jgi:hypothetical protein